METKPNNPASKPASGTAPAVERYFPGDPIPVPEATEATSDSAWALFSDDATTQALDFADTVPLTLPLESAKDPESDSV